MYFANSLSLQSFSAYYVAKGVIANLPLGNDPEKEQHEKARVKAAAILQRLQRSLDDPDGEDSGGRPPRARKEELELDQYENRIAMEVVAPEDIPVGFTGPLYPLLHLYIQTNP